MRTAFINEVMALAAIDKRIMLVNGDLGYSVLEGFMEKFPERYINVGIAEQNMIGLAAGLALSGKLVFTYSIANFATLRCLEQIRDDVCYHNANVKIISVGAGFAYATQGYTHFGVEDLAILRALPNLTVFSPSDPLETKLAVQQAVAINGPCYLRLGKAKENVLYSDPAMLKVETFPAINSLLHKNSRRALLTTGSIAAEALNYVTTKQLDLNLWTVPHIKPIDEKTLVQIANESDVIFTLEEHQLSGGFGSAILEAYERLVTKGDLSQFPKIQRIGINDLIPKYIGSQTYMRREIDFAALN